MRRGEAVGRRGKNPPPRPRSAPRRVGPRLVSLLLGAGAAGAILVAGWWVAARGPEPTPERGQRRPASEPGAASADSRPSRPPEPAARSSREVGPGAPAVERLAVRAVAVHPHDPTAYTQGLLWEGGQVMESTGLYGSSSLRRWNLASGQLLARVDLPGDLFGEGLARVGDRLIQLTWQEGKALLWDLRTFARLGEVPYPGEGWGLCFDGRRLVMSDGSAELVFRDPERLGELGRVVVTLDGEPVDQLNELECVGEAVFANVWGDDRILRIDPKSGRVTAVADASGLLSAAERARAEVLNGIAYRPETNTYLLTGKLWPKLFEVELVAAGPE